MTAVRIDGETDRGTVLSLVVSNPVVIDFPIGSSSQATSIVDALDQPFECSTLLKFVVVVVGTD